MAAKMVLDPQEVEELILDTIENIQVKKKRANSISVCKTLSKTHGLNDSTTSLQLTMMLAEGKIEDTRTGGSESFRVCEPGNILKQKKQEKVRKISDEEQRLAECRNELLFVATTPKPQRTEGPHKRDEKEKSSSENNNAYSQSANGKEVNHGFEDRLQKMEKHLLTIFERLDKVEEGNTNTESMQGKPTEFYEMFAKINSLEREKKDLKDENFALRLEITDLKEIIGKNLENKLDKNGENFRKKGGKTAHVDKNNFTIPRDDRRSSIHNIDSDFMVETNPWRFPKRTVKSRQCPEMFVETQNRFSGLEKCSEHYTLSNDNAFAETTIPQSFSDQPLEYVERKRAQNQSEKSTRTSPKKTIRNVVPGELSFAEATAAKPRTAIQNSRSSPNKQGKLQSNSQAKSRI